MRDWKDWVKCDDEYSPIEIHDDGTADIVVGMCLVVSLDDMKLRADRIFEVDDLFSDDPHPRLIWESPLPDPPKVIEVERILVSDDQSQAITEALHQGKDLNR